MENFISISFYASCYMTLGKSICFMRSLICTERTHSILLPPNFLAQSGCRAPFFSIRILKALMEFRQNKVLLPSAGPQNIPAHQCNGLAHSNIKVLLAFRLRRHGRKPQRKEANFVFRKIMF